jgi:Poly (ADP-ribose) glycohydrolase (PARG)
MQDLLVYRKVYIAQDLIAKHPAKLNHKYKKLVYRIACPEGSIHKGTITVSRWRAMSIESMVLTTLDPTEIETRSGYFTYEPTNKANEIEWHLNFADAYLFFAYGSPLLAQDEMQVAEHPALASVREALLAEGIAALTVENKLPTPILIREVERRCAIATNPDAEADRPLGLYGGNFSRASRGAIEQATRKIEPPSISNIIAIEAPPGETGIYTETQIEYILTTVVTGFSAAKSESHASDSSEFKVIIHTGYWGCGAYGGNRVLMALLQIIAANLAKIDRLVFYTGDVNNSKDLEMAQELLKQFSLSIDLDMSIPILSSKIHAMKFQWGIGNGT